MTKPAPAGRTVACPSCGARVAWEPGSSCRPFCSERCRLVDLGAWVSESYRVPAEEREGADDSAS
ncbi:MAG TPA: DNA gyrase inhibitor YacG [Casimicrobiaceae bacterium]|nr:DNA gyrase inhibitor YacG [Casimicrobiaceae bacterium]